MAGPGSRATRTGRRGRRTWRGRAEAAAMAADQMPDGIRPDEARGPKRRRITAALPRVVLGIFAAFVVAGLLNVFGQTTTTSRTSTERANLTVTAPGALRGGLIFQLVIEVVARADLGDARLVLSQGWFSGFTTNSEVPQPSMQDSVNGRAVF